LDEALNFTVAEDKCSAQSNSDILTIYNLQQLHLLDKSHFSGELIGKTSRYSRPLTLVGGRNSGNFNNAEKEIKV